MMFIPPGSWQVHDPIGRRKYVTSAERRAFLAAADTLPPEVRALCHVLAYSGCRISEALALQRHQLDAEAHTLLFRTLKRRRTLFRAVPIPVFVTAMLLALPPVDHDGFWRMHRTTALRHVQRAMARAGIVGPMACARGLRHGFGIRAATCNVPPSLIQRWMGHSALSTSAIYLDAVGLEERSFAGRMW